MLVNKGGWVFDDVHQQYTIGLIVARAGHEGVERKVSLRGPFSSPAAYHAGMQQPAETLAADDLLSWSARRTRHSRAAA
jgi:hypothetical protein